MPAPAVKTLAKKAGWSVEKAERAWSKIKAAVVGQTLRSGKTINANPDTWGSEEWSYVMGSLKNAMNIDEVTQHSPKEAAKGMLKRYSKPKTALDMALDHAMDHPRGSKEQKYWAEVRSWLKWMIRTGKTESIGQRYAQEMDLASREIARQCGELDDDGYFPNIDEGKEYSRIIRGDKARGVIRASQNKDGGWEWTAELTDPSYKIKTGDAKDQKDAIKKAEQAAKRLGMKESATMNAEQLIEQSLKDGRLPADIVRDMLYGGPTGSPLHESIDEVQVNVPNGFKPVGGSPLTKGADGWIKRSKSGKVLTVDTVENGYKAYVRPKSGSSADRSTMKTFKSAGDAFKYVLSLGEDTGGDVAIPINNGEDDAVAELAPNEAAFYIETAEEKAQWRDLIFALDGAQVKYDIEEIDETGETILKWDGLYATAVENTLTALGVEFEDDDSPEANVDYNESEHNDQCASDLIDAVIDGGSIEDVLDGYCDPLS